FMKAAPLPSLSFSSSRGMVTSPSSGASRFRPLRHEVRLVAQVNDNQAVQVAVLQLRPAPARHLGHVGPVRPFPGPLDARLPDPCARSPVCFALAFAIGLLRFGFTPQELQRPASAP